MSTGNTALIAAENQPLATVRWKWLAFWVGALVVVTRLPYLLTPIIDGDESTFVLLAQSVLDGYLPYIELWDNKGPIGIFTYALALFVFDENIIALRIVAALLIVITAIQLCMLTMKFADYSTAIVVTGLYIVTSAAIPSGQALMMEYIALPFLLGALLLLIRSQPSYPAVFFAGALIALAALVRMNLGLMALTLGVFIVLRWWSQGVEQVLTKVATFAFGGFAAVAVNALPYMLMGAMDTFVRAVFVAPLAYSGGNMGVLDSARATVYQMLGIYVDGNLHRPELWIDLLIWAPAVIGLVLGIKHILARHEPASRTRWLGFMLVAGTVGLSILLSGSPFPHHFLQLLPFGALLAGLAYSSACRLSPAAATAIGIVIAVVVSQTTIAEYPRFFARVVGNSRETNHAAEIVAFIAPRCERPCTLFMLNDYIVYWLLRTPLPTKFAHQAPLVMQSAYVGQPGVAGSPLAEMQRIFTKPPQFFVKRTGSEFPDDPALAQFMKETLDTRYQLVATIDDREIFERR